MTLDRGDLTTLAASSLDEGRPWREQVEELGVSVAAVESQGARIAQLYGGMSVDFHRAVEGAFASGFHLGLLAGLALAEERA